MRHVRIRAAAVLVAALAASGGILAATQPAAAAVMCQDWVLGAARVATYVGNTGFDGPVVSNGAVVNTLAGNDMVSVETGATRVVVCLGEGDDTFEGVAPGATRPTAGSLFSVEGGPGSDGIEGGDGFDILVGEDGADMIAGEAGPDRIMGGNGNDDLYGGDGNDTIYAGSGDDYLFGDAGDDILMSDGGDDVLDGGPGTDSCVGPGTFVNCETIREVTS
ncbi:calcium-binding protein [Actinoplanes sp. ATCC 53533]|uniref:calcium-binding protein n=1 Tax=Actinoplanes sp. ATCC 53533 TaxID=1288362 RepID=UPI0013154F3C|nr:calcium-binding protein [Actinoplanes sp. ATCC 53533]